MPELESWQRSRTEAARAYLEESRENSDPALFAKYLGGMESTVANLIEVIDALNGESK